MVCRQWRSRLAACPTRLKNGVSGDLEAGGDYGKLAASVLAVPWQAQRCRDANARARLCRAVFLADFGSTMRDGMSRASRL